MNKKQWLVYGNGKYRVNLDNVVKIIVDYDKHRILIITVLPEANIEINEPGFNDAIKEIEKLK